MEHSSSNAVLLLLKPRCCCSSAVVLIDAHRPVVHLMLNARRLILKGSTQTSRLLSLSRQSDRTVVRQSPALLLQRSDQCCSFYQVAAVCLAGSGSNEIFYFSGMTFWFCSENRRDGFYLSIEIFLGPVYTQLFHSFYCHKVLCIW